MTLTSVSHAYSKWLPATCCSVSYSNTRQSFNPGYYSFFRGTRNILPTDPNGGVEVVGLQERTSRAAVKRRHTATLPLRIRFCLVLTFILHPHIIPKPNESHIRSCRHPANTTHQAVINRSQRHQRPPPTKQPNHQRIQQSSVCGNDVQEYAAISGHDDYGNLTVFSMRRTNPVRLRKSRI